MDAQNVFKRRRLQWIGGHIALAGLVALGILGWRSGRVSAGTSLLLVLIGTNGFLIWGIAGANWVLKAGRGSAEAPDIAEERRLRRRAYLAGTIPAGLFLWRQFEDLPASPQSLGDVIFLPILAVAAAVFYLWIWGAVMSRFFLMMRRSARLETGRSNNHAG